MGLVNELQESAEREDVLTVLRKAKRVSTKLNLSEISEWLDHEQNGYPKDKPLPLYRMIHTSFYYNTNGLIPAGYGYLREGTFPCPYSKPLGITFSMTDPISRVFSLITGLQQNQGLYVNVPDDCAEILRSQFRSDFPEYLQRLTFLSRLDDSEVRDIPEQVKNKVLDWACALETAGIAGAEHSFSDHEKQKAETVVFNIVNSTIGQLNNAGSNINRKNE